MRSLREACRAKPPNADAQVFFPANYMCHNLFLSTFLVLLNPGTITFTFTISIIRIQAYTAGNQSEDFRDYNRAKFAFNFSFVGLRTLASCSFGHKLVLDTIVIRIRIFTILGLIVFEHYCSI